jgi:hypothetical protein
MQLGTALMAATVFNKQHSVLLDFTEMLMGPAVQHDSLQIACYPPVADIAHRGIGFGWHHDGFNTSTTATAKGPKQYTPPQACNCLTYLQDMTETNGPFRCVPGSHLDFSKQAPPQEGGLPTTAHVAVPGEVGLDGKVGDLVITHCDLLHGSTHNTGDRYRYFISEYVEQAGLPHRDSMHDGAWLPFIEEARQRGDARVLRFFNAGEQGEGEGEGVGVGGHHQARLEAGWARLVAEERASAKL